MAGSGRADSAPPAEIRHRGLLITGIMLAMIMQVLDTTIANVALPHMQTSLGATSESVTWVLTSYILAVAVAMPLTGWLSDRVGARRLFLISISGFIITSMLCGIAVNLSEMVVFRVLQGASAAFVGPLSQTLMLDITPREQHGRAMALWGMGIMVGPILGPVIGGWLTESYNWRWVFYINLPIGIVTLLLLWALLPARPVHRRAFDMFGYAMLAIALVALQLMLDRGQQEDWLNAWEIRIELGITVAAFWLFLVHMATGRRPMFERTMLADRNFLLGMVFMSLIGMLMISTMVLLPPMLQAIYGYPVLDTGLLLAPRGVGVLISMAMTAQIINRTDPRLLVAVGMLITALSLWWMTRWSLDMDWHPVIWSGLMQGFGLGMMFSPLNLVAFTTLSPRQRTDAASLLYLMRNIGSSVGIAILVSQLARSTQTSHADLVQHVTEFRLGQIDPRVAEQFGSAGASAYTALDAEISRQAAMIGYINDFHLLMLFAFAALPLVLLLRRPAVPAA